MFAKTIFEDTEHGASHILKIAAGSLHTALRKNPDADPGEIRASVKEFALRIVSGQRQMASILNFSNMLLIELSLNRDDSSLAKSLRDFAIRITAKSNESMEAIGRLSAELIQGNRFMTHSRSSTLLHSLTHLRDREDAMIFVTYSRPGGEGRLLAGELTIAGIRTILIEESEAMSFLPGLSGLLVGADAVIPMGVVNKIGTHMLALSAKDAGVPVYCLTESIKIWPFDEPIASEVTSKSSQSSPGRDLFEIIPVNLFKMIILETGQLAPEDIAASKTKELSLAPEILELVMKEH
ncbi:MAG: hypothetical protein OEV21_04060 [Thermoplasmata archaeon]|nr:hypothetical protein [Thermoplasmata archaeon]